MVSIRSGTITFGLVAIPVRVYVATHSAQLSFNLLHQGCGARIRQQLRGARIRQKIYCPQCARVVERRDLVKGYAFAKDRYVTFTDAELEALAAVASPTIEIHEFVPLAGVDPLYFADGHYLGPDAGGEKAYQLLTAAMRDRGRVAIAQQVTHGKEHLALIRPIAHGLVLHTLYYADEVRPLEAIATGHKRPLHETELRLARRLIDQLSAADFHPEAYHDTYRRRLEAVVQQKIEGKAVTILAPTPAGAPIIDLMEALKASLGCRSRRGAKRPVTRPAGKRAAGARQAPTAGGLAATSHAGPDVTAQSLHAMRRVDP
jgi:DNA end-binding protein Ku